MATVNNETLLSSIIETSQLIKSGSPKIYRLNPVTVVTEGLKKVTLGTKKVDKLNKTIVLVGETGTGKSTLINVLVNYAMGVKWEDDVWFEIIQQESTNQSESQTSDVSMYQIFGFEEKTLPFSLTIIDTPGYGDNRKDKNDNTIAERLLEWFSSDEGVNDICAVGLVLKATDNRLSDRLWYIFDSVVSLFGANMEKNIFALMTHSDGGPPENALRALQEAKIKFAKDIENQPVYFTFNNRQSAQRTTQYMYALKFAWDFSNDQMKQFMEVLKVTEPKTLRITVDVMRQRIGLKACIFNLQEKLKFTEAKITQVKQERELYMKCKDKMKKNEKYEAEVDEPYKDKQDIEGGRWGFLWLSFKGAMSCLECKETCHHEGCIHSTSPYDSRCVVFDGRGRCTVCTNHCDRKFHVKEKWIYVTKTRKVKKTYEDMKMKYEDNKDGAMAHLSASEKIQEEINSLEKEEEEVLEKSFKHINTLERIALNVDSMFTFKHLDFLIERMGGEKFAEKVKKLEEIKQRMGKKVPRHVLKYEELAESKGKLKKEQASFKYKNIIKTSQLIQSGSPKIYQLNSVTKIIKGLKTVTLGTKKVDKLNKTIVLVGETGAGKSTLINVLVNYAMGVKWEDDIWFEIIQQEATNQSESQTSDVSMYQIFGFEGKTLPFSLTIIDTPGYGHTGGTERDIFIGKKLLEWFSSDEGVNEISAVGLVLKATDNRLSDRLWYIFDSVVSVFGANMEKNMFALMTHSDGGPPENALRALQEAKIKFAKDIENQPVYFTFNNRQSAQRTRQYMYALKFAWDLTIEQLRQFMEVLKVTEPQNREAFVDILRLNSHPPK